MPLQMPQSQVNMQTLMQWYLQMENMRSDERNRRGMMMLREEQLQGQKENRALQQQQFGLQQQKFGLEKQQFEQQQQGQQDIGALYQAQQGLQQAQQQAGQLPPVGADAMRMAAVAHVDQAQRKLSEAQQRIMGGPGLKQFSDAFSSEITASKLLGLPEKKEQTAAERVFWHREKILTKPIDEWTEEDKRYLRWADGYLMRTSEWGPISEEKGLNWIIDQLAIISNPETSKEERTIRLRSLTDYTNKQAMQAGRVTELRDNEGRVEQKLIPAGEPYQQIGPEAQAASVSPTLQAGVVTGPPKLVTPAEQRDVSAALASMDRMKKMRKSILLYAGYPSGLKATAQVYAPGLFGENKDAAQFIAEKKAQFLDLQSFVKGTPSDKDMAKAEGIFPSLFGARELQIQAYNSSISLVAGALTKAIRYKENQGEYVSEEWKEMAKEYESGDLYISMSDDDRAIELLRLRTRPIKNRKK